MKMFIDIKNREKKKRSFKSILFVLVLGSLIGVVCATNLTFTPTPSQVALGEEFAVNVTIDDVVDLYSFQFDVFYDPVMLQYVSVNEGSFLSSDGEGTIDLGPDSGTPGLLDNYAVTRYGSGIGGITGSNGFLAEIRFISLAEGTTELGFEQSFLYDSTTPEPQEIFHDTENGTINSIDCDVDGDTHFSIACGGADCNDSNPLEFPNQDWYLDADNDLYSTGALISQCFRPVDYKANSELIQTFGDCNDGNGNINPGVAEICDGIDNNCDLNTDEGFSAEDCQPICEGAGFNFSLSRPLPYTCCGNGAGENNPYEDPETSCYDNNDNDCDGYADILDSDCSGVCGDTGEDDLWISGEPDCNQCDHEGDDDGNQFGGGGWAIYPGMADQCDAACNTVSTTVLFVNYEDGFERTCDGIDNDCDGVIDDDGVLYTFYFDFDNDDYGNVDVNLTACTPPEGYVPDNTDCDDNDGDEHPGQIWYADIDGDSYSNGTTQVSCEQPLNYYIARDLIGTTGDCNDEAPAINPGVAEICDGIDNNCDLNTDEGFSAEDCQPVCEGLGFNYSLTRLGGLRCCGNDANENNPFEDPEITCTGNSDNDCDGLIDILDSDCSGVCGDTGEDDFWVSGQGNCDQCDYGGDQDGDQPGWAGSGVIADQCDSDCDIVTTTVQWADYDGSTESTCDGIDNDCDGVIDDDGVKTTYYEDSDGDGFGNPAMTQEDCSAPIGYVDNSLDCDDTDEYEYPNQVWYKDADGDSYSDGVTQSACERPTNYYLDFELNGIDTDCDDDIFAINPGATEICDDIDNNCDTNTDEGFDAEECMYVCQATFYNYDGSRGGDLRCCGNDANEASPYQDPEADCTDNNDNDCDGYIDIFDSDCSGLCTDSGEDDFWVSGQGNCGQCDHEGDDDGDQPGDWSSYPGTADRCDSDCGVVLTTIQLGDYETSEVSCWNGIDDDCDTLIDASDDDCLLVRYDLNGDGIVDITDLIMAAMEWGSSPCDTGNSYCNRADVDRDGQVFIGDLTRIGINFT